MTIKSKAYDEKSQKESIVFAYGFDAFGFETPNEPILLKNYGSIKFIKYNDTEGIDSADGVIIPQGIFETFTYIHNSIFPYTNVRVNKPLLLQREREVVNLFREGKWICFLVGKIVDRVPYELSSVDVKDTDLCKRILNIFGVRRQTVDGLTLLNVKYDEFKAYIHKYGVAQTILLLPYNGDSERRVLVEAGNRIVGFEFLSRLFFLPFQTTDKSSSTAASIVKGLTQAIFDFRQKRILEIPAWVDELQFRSEENLQNEINSLIEQVNKFQSQLESWRSYKSILTTSADILKDKLIKILENFFQLKIDPIDNNREDAKIIDANGNTSVIIEIKGTKTGIKREYVNQVDSHRERNELPASIPGVLFINNEMSVVGINNRIDTKVPNEQIKHAKNLNILIVRTIDLLFLMLHLENIPDKKGEFMKLLLAGGGWLKADSEGYEIVMQ